MQLTDSQDPRSKQIRVSFAKELDLLRGIFANRIAPRDCDNSVPEQCLSEEDVRVKHEESDDDNGNNSDMSAGAGVLMDHEYCS